MITLRTAAFLVALAPVCVVQTTAAHADADDAGFHLEQITDAGELAALGLDPEESTYRVVGTEPASDLLDSWHEMAANRDMFPNVGWTTIGPADFLLWHDQVPYSLYQPFNALACMDLAHTVPAVAPVQMTNDRRPRFLNLWVHDGAESGHLQGTLIARCPTPGNPNVFSNYVLAEVSSLNAPPGASVLTGMIPVGSHHVDNSNCSYTVVVQFVTCAAGPALQLRKARVLWD